MYYEVFKNLRLELVNEGKLNLRTMEADFLKFLKIRNDRHLRSKERCPIDGLH